MATQASAATGIQLRYGTSTVPEVTNLSDIGGQFTMVDVSAHDGNGWTSRIPTLLDGGVIRVLCNFVPNNAIQKSLRDAMLARTSGAFSIIYPNAGPTWTFNAFVMNYRIPSAAVNAALQVNIDLQVDGPITMP